MRARELLLALSLSLPLACASAPPVVGSIGVYARQEAATKRIVVTGVPPGLGGARAGLEVGDEIVAVDGTSVKDLGVEGFRGAVRGPVGSKVVLLVKRNGNLVQITVERTPIKIVAPEPSSST